MGKYVLGIHGGIIGHDPNICVLDIESNEYWHIEEERISRKKHRTSKIKNCVTYKNNFIKFITNMGISWNDIEHIVYSADQNVSYSDVGRHGSSKIPQIKDFHSSIFDNINLIDLNKKMFMFDSYKTYSNELQKDVYFLNHHIAHGAYTYFTSPFNKSIIFSYDGSGYEESYAMSMFGDENKLSNFRDYPKLMVGIWYHAISNAIFKSFNKDCKPYFWEGKMMALSSYGEPIYLDVIKEKLYIKGDPFRSFDHSIFKIFEHSAFDVINSSQNIREFYDRHGKLLDVYPQEGTVFSFLVDIACSWQTYIEELIVECMVMLRDHYHIRNLCIGGGCGLNGVINYKLMEHFDNVHIAPATSDSGLSIGCAMYGKHVIMDIPKVDYGNVSFKGMEYDIDEKTIKKYDVTYEKHEYNDIYKIVAKEIYENRIVAWYQGRSESGPRALGNRSILANATNKDMKDILNSRVKHREWFRPFAPSIMKEYVNDYFYDVTDEKYMLKIAKIKEDMLDVIPSTVHVDGTGRVQTVTPEDNEHFYNLIKAFYNISGVPVILNTSFNLQGEPIVETPDNALKTFTSTEIDILVLKNYIVRKVNGN